MELTQTGNSLVEIDAARDEMQINLDVKCEENDKLKYQL